MGLGGAPTCRHCFNLRSKCTCRCPRCNKTLPDCKCPAVDNAGPATNASANPAPEDDPDPHIRTIMRAYHDPEGHTEWIDGLTARELIRRIDGEPSPYSKAVQPYVRELVKYSKAKLIERGRLLEEAAAHSHPPARLLARPVPRHRVVVAPAGASTHAAFVRKQQLAAYHLLPELLAGLADFLAAWRVATAPITRSVGTPESFAVFLTASTILNTSCFLIPEFRVGLGEKTSIPRDEHGKLLDSPYFHAYGAQPSQRGSPDGSNAWLDRFLYARRQFRAAVDRVVFNPYVVHMSRHGAAPAPDVPPALVADLTAVKREFAALFALCCCPLSLSVHDFSAAGRAPRSKWYAAGGAFRLWTSETAHEPLSDPQGLQAALLGVSELRFVGRALADLPGAFPDVETATQTTIARLRAKQVSALAATISDTKQSPFRDPEQRHPQLDDVFYGKIRHYVESTRSAREDPVRAARSAQAVVDNTAFDLARLKRLRLDDWYRGPLTNGHTVLAAEVVDAYARHAARPASGRFELLVEDAKAQDSSLSDETREDTRLADIRLADEDMLQAVLAQSQRDAVAQPPRLADRAYLAQPPAPPRSGDHAYLAQLQDAFRERMRTVTAAEVRVPSFRLSAVNVALAVRGITIPDKLKIAAKERKELLLTLLEGTPEQVVRAFADRRVTLVHHGDLWKVLP